MDEPNEEGERKPQYFPTTVEVECKCGHIFNIRINQQHHSRVCSRCNRKVTVTIPAGHATWASATAQQYFWQPAEPIRATVIAKG